ncbi:MAG TPA: permease-like cell division protein FtsX [Gaiellaceae bacterium]|nr:permease-like cell division protein FtsX [Gaiellaceae bacterium]
MARFKLLLSEAVRSLFANISTTAAATMTVLIGMFLLGFLIGLSTWAFSLSNHYKHELVVKVYFNHGVADNGKEVNDVRSKLIANPLVKSVTPVTAEQGLAQMRKKNPELFKGSTLPYNPLGPALTVQPKRGEDTVAIANTLKGPPPGVHDVNYGKKTAHKLLTAAKVIDIFFVLAVIVLLVSSTLLIGNTIRLAIFSRRREIEVMKLVGATNWFIRGPFMLEGLITGLVGSLAAIVLLVLGKEIALPRIMPHVIRASDIHAWPFGLTALIILGTGLLLGAAGSGLTIRRFLQV